MRRKDKVSLGRVQPERLYYPNVMRTAVEVYKDGHREVFHQRVNDSNEGWVWTHPDTPAEKAACSACTSGTLVSIKAEDAARERAFKEARR